MSIIHIHNVIASYTPFISYTLLLISSDDGQFHSTGGVEMQSSCSSEVGIAIGAAIIAVCLVVMVIIIVVLCLWR